MRSRRKGIVGIEAAIVLIAFVIVAASLAFVALNMGLFTTQKSKEVMQRGLEESTTALEVDGSVTAYTSDGTSVSVASIPIKVAPGRNLVDLNKNKASIRLLLPNTEYENINEGVYTLGTDSHGYYILYNATNPSDYKNTTKKDTSIQTFASTLWSSAPTEPQAYIIILKPNNNNTVLEYGEKAIVLVHFDGNGIKSYQSFTVEIRPPEGAPLTVERTIPASLPSSGSFDLG